MPSAKGIRAGKAFVEISADDNKMTRALERASRRLRYFGKNIAAVGSSIAKLGGAALMPLIGAAKVFSSFGDNVAKMSKRTGVSVETLSELRYVASQSGTEFATLENAFRKMQRSIYDAGRGLSTQVDALRDLGLVYADLKNLSPEQQFKLLADRISNISDPTKKAALAMSIMGRTGTNLLPMFEKGAKGIEELQAKARELGLTMSADDAKAAEEFTDTMDSLWKSIKMGVFQVGAALAPVLQDLAQKLTAVAATARAWIDENRAFIQTALKVAAAVVAIGVGVMVIGKVITIMGTLIKIVRGVVIAVKALAAAFTWLMAHPVVLAFVAIVAVVAATAIAVRALTAETINLSDEMSKLRKKGDEARRVDLDRMKRLEQLAAKESLNNAEMAEASTLITALQGKYGDLGLAINKATGEIEGMREAQISLMDVMRERAIGELEKEKREARSNWLAKRKEAREFPSTFGGSYWGDLFFDGKEKLSGINDELATFRRTYFEIAERIRRLQGGDKDALTGGKRDEAAELRTRIAAETQQKRMASADESTWARKVSRLKIQLIENEYERRKKALYEEYLYEEKLAREKGATQATLANINEAFAIRHAQIERERIAQSKEEAARLAASRADANQSRGETIEELQLRTKLKGLALEKALLALERKREIDAARKAGERLDLVEKEYDLRAQMLNAGAKLLDAGQGLPERLQTSVTGTFNAKAIASLNSTAVASRTAKATEATAKNTKRILEEAQRNTIAFA